MAIRKGDAAKEIITKSIIDTFPGSFVADKKIYVTVKDGDNGEQVQIAVALTMPKTPVVAAGGSDAPVGESSSVQSAGTVAPVELSPADRAKVDELKARLGIVD